MYFITGTDTNIGKSFVSALLVKKLQATYFKPIQAGDLDSGGDTQTVQTLAGVSDKHFIPPLYALKQPISPHEAARLETIVIDIEKIIRRVKQHKDSPLIIEGAGGLMVPLGAHDFMIDLIQKINFPVILVTSLALGTFNHTFLSLEALQKRNIPIKGIILNGDGDREYVQRTIETYTNIPIVGYVPFTHHLTDDIINSISL